LDLAADLFDLGFGYQARIVRGSSNFLLWIVSSHSADFPSSRERPLAVRVLPNRFARFRTGHVDQASTQCAEQVQDHCNEQDGSDYPEAPACPRSGIPEMAATCAEQEQQKYSVNIDQLGCR
jgi:hypothetical protein